MRSPILFTIIILVTACSQNKEQAMRAEIDSLQATFKRDSLAQQQLAIDSSVFVSHVSWFEQTKELYVSLYALKDHSAYDSKYIKSQLDSVIYSDEHGIKRTRLPLNVANQFFNLTGLERVTIYSREGKILADGLFERVEYLEGEIESEYVAVFKPISALLNASEISYCISSFYYQLDSLVPHEEFNDKNITAKLIEKFNIDSTKIWHVQHLHFLRDNHIWSVISTDPGSYIIETTGPGTSAIVHQIAEEYSIMEIIPIDIEVNGKPVLLATAGVNETDLMWSTLLVYKNGWYEVMKMGRIEN